MLKVNKISKPKGLAYPLAKVKEHLRLTSDDVSGLGDDRLIAGYISAAADFIRSETWQILQSTDYVGYLDQWSSTTTIYEGPVTEITSVKYYDTSGTLQTMTVNTDYEVDLNSTHACIYFKNTPGLRDRQFNNIEITYKAGYSSYREVPDDIIHALRLIVSDFYENRQSNVIGMSTSEIETPASVKTLLANNSRRVFT